MFYFCHIDPIILKSTGGIELECNAELDLELEEIKSRWKDIFFNEIQSYAFADAELNEEMFSSLIFDTAKALNMVFPQKSADALYCWEGAIGVFAYLKAFSIYPTVTSDHTTLNFDVAKMISKRLIERFEIAQENCSPWNIFEKFTIPMDCLPDQYEKNPVGTAFIPYNLESGDFTPIKNAIMDGGIYCE